MVYDIRKSMKKEVSTLLLMGALSGCVKTGENQALPDSCESWVRNDTQLIVQPERSEKVISSISVENKAGSAVVSLKKPVNLETRGEGVEVVNGDMLKGEIVTVSSRRDFKMSARSGPAVYELSVHGYLGSSDKGVEIKRDCDNLVD